MKGGYLIFVQFFVYMLSDYCVALNILRIKYFVVLPNSGRKQIFTDKIFVVKVPVMHCICYEVEISREKIFVAIRWPAKSTKIFNLENFRLYSMHACIHVEFLNSQHTGLFQSLQNLVAISQICYWPELTSKQVVKGTMAKMATQSRDLVAKSVWKRYSSKMTVIWLVYREPLEIIDPCCNGDSS